mmetsp:Transcript_30924/g.74687  ORF Transcript_30924/g.74687 Transcript_30924/m.74687 type:complete len:533 (+) Transcript_30924:114-1712(+)
MMTFVVSSRKSTTTATKGRKVRRMRSRSTKRTVATRTMLMMIMVLVSSTFCFWNGSSRCGDGPRQQQQIQMVMVASAQEYDTSKTRALIKWKIPADPQAIIDKILEYAEGGQVLELLVSLFLISIAIDESNRDAIVKFIEETDLIEYAEIDQLRGTQEYGPHRVVSTEEHRQLQVGGQKQPYSISMVQVDFFWGLPDSTTDAKVCVVDTGYDVFHEDLSSALDPLADVDGTTTPAGTWYTDVQGHGTHCSGTIGALDNGFGVVGVREKPADSVVHIGRGLNDDGNGYTSTILGSVNACVEAGARVVSLSLGGTYSSQAEQDFYNDVYNSGVLIVAAAGNDGDNGYQYPAAYPSVMSVAAVDESERRPTFSQCNDQVEIAAPGVNILSTYPPNQYAVLSGTSMACPLVAGVAAQLMSYFPECTNYQIRNVLHRTAKVIGQVDKCNNGYGSGLIQGKDAYDVLQAEGCAAGGPVITDNPAAAAVGGCEQNPDYDSFNNTYRDSCPGGSVSSASGGLATYGILACISAASLLFSL